MADIDIVSTKIVANMNSFSDETKKSILLIRLICVTDTLKILI